MVKFYTENVIYIVKTAWYRFVLSFYIKRSESRYTVRNKDHLDSGIRTLTLNLALLSYLNLLYSGRYGDILILLTISDSVR